MIALGTFFRRPRIRDIGSARGFLNVDALEDLCKEFSRHG
jgi:hypothetical protein